MFPPNDKINIAQVGYGRIAKDHDLPLTIKHDSVRIVAVADVDRQRAEDGKRWLENWYRTNRDETDVVIDVYRDYRELLLDKSIDAVIISTPDHWHARPAIEAAFAGKDVYLQKPAALTIKEGRQMSDVIIARAASSRWAASSDPSIPGRSFTAQWNWCVMVELA